MKPTHLFLNFVFIILGMFFFFSSGTLYADSEDPNYDSHEEILTLQKVSIDHSEWYEDVRLKLDFKASEFELLSATEIIDNRELVLTSADSDDPNFDSREEILTLQRVSIDRSESDRYRDVKIKLDFTTGKLELLSASKIDNSRFDNRELVLTNGDFCADNYPRLFCSSFDQDINNSSQFVLGSSCSESFPEQTYLFAASTGNFCDEFGSCGACAMQTHYPEAKTNTERIQI